MTRWLFAFFVCLVLLSACSTKHYRASADKEVAKIIAQKTPKVPNMDTNFTVEATNEVSLKNFPVFDKPEESFGADKEMDRGARIFSLNDSLAIAIRHSNEYQTEKEGLFEDALALTLVRHRYTPIFSGNATAVEKRTPLDVKRGVNTVVEHEDSVKVSSKLTMKEELLRTGGKITTAFTTDFLRFVTGDPRLATSSELSATLVQPLWRGAGYKVAVENLTQSERNVLYSLRTFTRFRKKFVVEVAAKFFDVLQKRDAVRNNWRGLQNFKENVARERAFYEEGLRSQASLDQLKQAELQTESKWISSVRAYRQSLDEFKIKIGLHTDDRIILDEGELERLKIVHPTLSIDDAVQVAMVSRLDLQTDRDKFEDAARHIDIAANGLRPDVDLIAGVSAGKSSGRYFSSPDWKRYESYAGVQIDLPLDRKAERNTYRVRLIDFAQSKRGLDLAIDKIKQELADDWRTLDQDKRTYEIDDLGVQIASRRVEEQQLRQELGRGTSRDLVDAQLDLIEAKNSRTAALVSHTIARLELYRDMGVLWVKDNGQWDENPNGEK